MGVSGEALADYGSTLKARDWVRFLATHIMPTPALQHFLNSTGRVVHHLNTLVVGLSAVEVGAATKPTSMDITWAPSDPITSSRQARAFALRSTLVFLAEEINEYIDQITKYPGLKRPSDWSDKKKADRIVWVHQHLEIEADFLMVGAVLVAHWRNRAVHNLSGSRLTDAQKRILISTSEVLGKEFKNLDPHRLLDDFEKNMPSLKDVSSLVAMTIRCVKRLDESIREPSSADDVKEWLDALDLSTQLDRVRRIAMSKGEASAGVETFLRTNCPELLEPYKYYCTGNP